MRAGKLDRRITIEQAAYSQDDFGQEQPVWTTFAERAAQRMDMKGTERFAANQVMATITATFRIRYLPGLKPTMRIVHEGKTYDITGIAELGRRRGLEITATARADNA